MDNKNNNNNKTENENTDNSRLNIPESEKELLFKYFDKQKVFDEIYLCLKFLRKCICLCFVFPPVAFVMTSIDWFGFAKKFPNYSKEFVILNLFNLGAYFLFLIAISTIMNLFLHISNKYQKKCEEIMKRNNVWRYDE